jgi:hypothetical protein
MKAKATRDGKGWLDRKLASPTFRKGLEEESRKLAIGEQLSRLRQEAGLTQAQAAKRPGRPPRQSADTKTRSTTAMNSGRFRESSGLVEAGSISR